MTNVNVKDQVAAWKLKQISRDRTQPETLTLHFNRVIEDDEVVALMDALRLLTDPLPEAPGAEEERGSADTARMRELAAAGDPMARVHPFTLLDWADALDAERAALSTARSTIAEQAATMLGLRAIAEAAEVAGWQPIDTAPRDQLIDIWIKNSANGTGVRWASCYYDHICDQWRTAPGGHLMWVPAHAVTHWQPLPPPPKESGHD